MESVNRNLVSKAIYPSLQQLRTDEEAAGWSTGGALTEGQWTSTLESNVIAAAAEGYCFPTNLDLDQPDPELGASLSQAELVKNALKEDWSVVDFELKVDEQLAMRISNGS